MKRKLPLIFFICLVPLLFTSCIEIIQTIDFENGNYKIGYRLTMSKALFALSNENPSSFFDDIDLSDFPKEVSVEKIDTSLDIGLGFKATVHPKTDSTVKDFLPKIMKDGSIKIPLIGADEIASKEGSSRDAESKAIASALLSSAKWHVYVTKKLIPSISKAYLENDYGTQNLEHFEIGNVFVINIPIVLIEKDTFLKVER